MNKLINTTPSNIVFTIAVISLIAVNSPCGFTQTKTIVVVQDEKGIHNSLSFSPDGKKLLTTGYETAIVWDAKTGEKLLTFDGHIPYAGAISCGVFSPDGTKIATGGYSLTTLIWDSHTGSTLLTVRLIKEILPWGINSVAFSPDGNNVAIGTETQGIQIWDIGIGKKIVDLKDLYTSRRIDYFQDGKKILTQAAGDITIISVEGEILIKYHINGVASLSKDGKYIRNIIGDIDGILDKHEVRINDAETNQRLSTYTFNAKKGSVFMSPDGQYILAASEKSPEGLGIRKVGALDSALRTFSIESNVDYNYMKVAFSDDNKKFACMVDTKAYIYDISDLSSAIKGSTEQ